MADEQPSGEKNCECGGVSFGDLSGCVCEELTRLREERDTAHEAMASIEHMLDGLCCDLANESTDLRTRLRDNEELDIEDIKEVVGFVLGWYPGYEDAIQWGDDDMKRTDYEWYVAAKRLRAAIDEEKDGG